MAPVHHQDRRRQHRDALTQLAPPGEPGEELLARAVTAALTQGASWAQIGARLGVPDLCAPDRECSDRQGQDAIVDHKNARHVQRLCRALGISRSGPYKHLATEPARVERQADEATTVAESHAIHTEQRSAYGAPARMPNSGPADAGSTASGWPG